MPIHDFSTTRLFQVKDDQDFNEIALDLFYYQVEYNAIYRSFVKHLKIDTNQIQSYHDIPFMPVEFFKTHEVTTGSFNPEIVFQSSRTTGLKPSSHYLKSTTHYREVFTKSFELFFGPAEDYIFLALLPSYIEREGSSLIFMVNSFINASHHDESGFYLYDFDALAKILYRLNSSGKKVILFGVTFALIDLAERHSFQFPDLIIIETGGMKGRREEMVREKMHSILKKAFGVQSISSEYGMTELLSQAYSKKEGLFQTPPWMKVLIRDTNDPLQILEAGNIGGINIIDLANVNSSAFIATKDLGKVQKNGAFEVLGRFDNSDIRGCNLMVV